MEFQKKMKQRLYIAISYIMLGLILIAAHIFSHSDNYFIFPFGIGLLIMGVLRIIRCKNITSDKKSMRKQELSETDERTRIISEKAKSWAFSCSILIVGIVVIVLSLLGYHDYVQPFAWYVCLMCILYWVFYLIASKKY